MITVEMISNAPLLILSHRIVVLYVFGQDLGKFFLIFMVDKFTQTMWHYSNHHLFANFVRIVRPAAQ